MLLAQKQNGNQQSFMQSLDAKSARFLKQQKDEFHKQIRKRFNQDFDRGFFSAWQDYIRLLLNETGDEESSSRSQGQTSISRFAEASELELL
jgi:hypothetical protein